MDDEWTYSTPRKRKPPLLVESAIEALALRRYLDGKIRDAVRYHDADEAPLALRADVVVVGLLKRGFIDDSRHAELRTHALLERGRSPRDVRHRLRAQGVADSTISATLAAYRAADGDRDPAFTAAIAYAKRRGFGPFRDEATRAERRERDLASMVRAGHDYAIARRVIDEPG
jgi:regulatory protein